MKLRSCIVTMGLLLLANLISTQADADPYPPVDQKRPALALKSHGIFWAGGQIVNRTQAGTENAGDIKDIPSINNSSWWAKLMSSILFRKNCATARTPFRSCWFLAVR